MEGKERMPVSEVAPWMLLVQLLLSGYQILSKLVLRDGMFAFALLAYRLIVGAFVILPVAIHRERASGINFSWSAFFYIFMGALSGLTMAMGFFLYGLKETSATSATNFLSLIPIMTFLLSTILRMENVGLRTKAGKIKVFGAGLSLGGTLFMIFYQGAVVGANQDAHHKVVSHTGHNWIRGTIFLICSCLCYGVWFIFQVKSHEVFPYRLWTTFFTCVVGTVQSVCIGLCIDTKASAWKVGWNLQLITILYSGALGSAASFVIISWAVGKRGPTYPSMFSPVCVIVVAIIEGFILHEGIASGNYTTHLIQIL